MLISKNMDNAKICPFQNFLYSCCTLKAIHLCLYDYAIFLRKHLTFPQQERQRDRETETERHRETETERQRQRQNQRDRDRETETETKRQRQRDRERERQRDRDRDREREREKHTRKTLVQMHCYIIRGCASGGVEFMYLVFTCMPGESYRRRLRSLLLYLCDVFRAIINSLVC